MLPRGVSMWIAVGMFACHPDDAAHQPPPAETGTDTAGTDSATPPPDNRLECEVDSNNALRVSCAVVLDGATGVELEVWDLAGLRPPQVFRSSDLKTSHLFAVTFLVPNQEYAATVRRDDRPAEPLNGTFRTPALYGGADMYLAPIGPGPAPLIGMLSPCSEGAVAVIVDPQLGVPVWYEDFADGYLGFIEAVSFTENRTVLAVVNNGVREVDLDGHPLLALDYGEELEQLGHHDVFRRDGLTYVLFTEEVATVYGMFALDGFYVFDSSGHLVATWHLSDHFLPTTPSADPFAIDVSHANSIWVGPDLSTFISFRHLSAIAKVDGDPFSPTFGNLHWVLSTPTSAWPSDFLLESEAGSADFFMQHNAFLLENGNLTFLDNRALVTEPSRVVEIALDEKTMQATIVQDWVLPVHCDFQGGAWRTPSDDPLATCAPNRAAYQIDDAQNISWTGQAVCRNGFGSYVPRFVPLEW